MAPDNPNEMRVDRNYFSVGTLDEESDERQYWLTKTPVERLLAVELTRQVIYGYAGATPGLQRVLEIAALQPG